MAKKIKTKEHPHGFRADDIALLLDQQQRYLYLKENLLRTRDMMRDVGANEACQPDRLLDGLAYYIDTAFNPDRCLCSCKNMYFCNLPAGHDGPHNSDGFKWAHEHDAGVADEIKELEALDGVDRGVVCEKCSGHGVR